MARGGKKEKEKETHKTDSNAVTSLERKDNKFIQLFKTLGHHNMVLLTTNVP